MMIRSGVWCIISLVILGCNSNPAPTNKPVEVKQSNLIDAVKKESSSSPGEHAALGTSSANDEALSLETMFSRVLRRGFKKANAKANVSFERCTDLIQKIVARGTTSVRFLQAKLTDGSLSEKALAMWLLGSMGESAKPASKLVIRSMSRSWQVPIERCIKKGKTRDACEVEVFGREGTWTIAAGCRALERMRSQSGILNVAKMGLSGRMMRPCVGAFLSELSQGVIRDRFIDSWEDSVIQGQVLAYLKNRPRTALSLALHWMRAESVADQTESRCPLAAVLGPVSEAHAMRFKGRVHPVEMAVLKNLSNEGSSAAIKTCVQPYLELFGAYDPNGSPLIDETPPPSTEIVVPEFGQFCPKE